MKFECRPNDPERFATNLRRENTTGNLIWDSAQGQDALIVQTPFGVSPTERIEEICEAMSRCELYDNAYTEVMNNICVRYVSATEKARSRGCVLNGEASTYTVFACSRDAGVCYVHKAQDQSVISVKCDIPLRIRVEIQKQTIRKGFICKRIIETGFYVLRFPDCLAGSLTDGDLAYGIGDFEIPVTRAMAKAGTVYVKSETKPKLIPKNKGFMLE